MSAVQNDAVSSTIHYVFPNGGELMSTATRRFRSEEEVRSSLEVAGFTIVQIYDLLENRPYDAVAFKKHTLGDIDRAWRLGHELGLDSDDAWAGLVEDYLHRDPIAVLPVLGRLVDNDLRVADARRYQSAAKRLSHMRSLATATPKAEEVDDLIAAIRAEHRNRPRLQRELDAQRLT